MYTFWDYMWKRWERDGGLRLDHILLSSTLTERLQSAGVDRQTRGMADASDHAPVWVRLRDGPDRRGNLLREASGKTIAAGTTAAPKTERSTHRTGDGTGRKRRPARTGQPALSGRPLLVIDGDSFAHRSYHALPKTIRRSDGKAAGAILGFANFLLRLYVDERPRAVIVGWDTLEAPALGPLHRLGDLCDRCSSFRMRFEFLNVFFRPRTAMRGRLLCWHEQSP